MILFRVFNKNLISLIRRKPNILNSQISFTNFSSYDSNLTLNGISLVSYIEELEKKYNGTITNPLETKADSYKLEPVMNILKDRRNIISNIKSLNELVNDGDKDLTKLAKEEIEIYESKLKSLDEKLIESILPADSEDDCNSMLLEVNAGVGGQEAMLFAGEVLNMYLKFAEYKGWETQLASFTSTDLGGVRHASFLINGDQVFRFLKYEAGVHRVQRIPSTEKGGRIHTSTVSVIALPQPPEIEICFDNKDLKIETKRASGAGGQHVNTTDSAVRIVHLPTGTSVECQVDRSQIKNKQIALMKLRALLYEKEAGSRAEKNQSIRSNQVRSNNRNEKIRTYNFHQDRITDHRLDYNIHNIKEFLQGTCALENLINSLDYKAKVEELLYILKNKR